MSASKTASRKSMRPATPVTPAAKVSGDGGQGTNTTSKRPSLDERITAARGTFGASNVALGKIERVAAEYETLTAGVAEWAAIAAQWAKAKRSTRDWAKTCGGSAMTLGRLLSVHDLITASRKGKATRTLTPREASKVANTNTRTEVAALVAKMENGEDPLATKTTAAGDVKGKRTARPNDGTKVKTSEVTPDQYPAVLRLILANMGKVSRNATAVEIATLAGEVQVAATKRAASLTTTRSRKSTATTAVAV